MKEADRAYEVDLRLAAESIPHIAWLAGPDGATEYLNHMGSEYTGMPPDANFGWGWLALVHPHDAERARSAWEDATRTVTRFEAEYRIRRFDGEYRWHAGRALPMHSAAGELVAWIGTAIDVDDRKRLEETLRTAERETAAALVLLDTLQSSAPAGLGFVDLEFRVVRINERLAAVSGRTVEEHIGRTLAEVIPALWSELEPAYPLLVVTGEAVVGREVVGPSASAAGGVRYWLTSFHPVRIAGELVGIGIAAFDVTERREAEEALRAAKEYAERLIETSNAMVLVLDPDGKVVVLNKAGEEITGYTLEELRGRSWDIVVPRERYPAPWRALDALGSGGPPERNENPIVTKSGEERFVLWRNSRLFEQDRMVGTVSFGIDVTESVRAKEEVARNVELLEIAGDERRRLLGRLVNAQEEERQRIAGDIHDGPLQSLSAHAIRLDMLSMSIDDPQLLRQLSEALQTVRTAIASLRGMMFELHPPMLDQAGLVSALELQLEQIRQEAGIQVKLESALQQEPPPETSAIAYRIAQEALLNVRKHARAERISVHLGQSPEGMLVRIRDDGCGFVPGPQQPGHLGLVSMRERAEMAGGWCRIESEPKRGTSVEFMLPAGLLATVA